MCRRQVPAQLPLLCSGESLPMPCTTPFLSCITPWYALLASLVAAAPSNLALLPPNAFHAGRAAIGAARGAGGDCGLGWPAQRQDHLLCRLLRRQVQHRMVSLPVNGGLGMPCPTMPCHAMPCHTTHHISTQCHAMPCYARPWLASSCHLMLPHCPMACPDCEHEVKPVTAGHRLCLTYNLLFTGDGPPPPAIPGGGWCYAHVTARLLQCSCALEHEPTCAAAVRIRTAASIRPARSCSLHSTHGRAGAGMGCR